MNTIETPELDKERKAREEGHSEAIGEFLEWLTEERGYTICELFEFSEGWSEWGPARVSIIGLLHEYFEIDTQAADRERRALLDALRAAQQVKT